MSLHEKNNSQLSWIQLSDTHIPDSREYIAWDEARPMVAAENTVARAVEVCDVDFAAHLGDICDVDGLGTDRSYRIADNLFSELKMPRYFVAGNHDDPLALIANLAISACDHWLAQPDMLCYQFTQKGVPFIVLDGRQGRSSRGYIGHEQQEWLVERLEAIPEGSRAVVLTHFPLFNDTVTWIRDRMLLRNATEIHEIFSRFSDKLVAVFHGHIHAAMQHTQDGVQYISAPSGSYPFDVKIDSSDVWIDPVGDVGFQVITLCKETWSLSIRQINNPRKPDYSFFGCVAGAESRQRSQGA